MSHIGFRFLVVFISLAVPHFCQCQPPLKYTKSVIQFRMVIGSPKDTQPRDPETGSGFLIDSRGYVLTAKHVVKTNPDDQSTQVKSLVGFFWFPSGPMTCSVRVLTCARTADIALVKVDCGDNQLTPLDIGLPFWGDLKSLEICGFPRGGNELYDRAIPVNSTNPRRIRVGPIYSGDSGGPAILDGKAIAICDTGIIATKIGDVAFKDEGMYVPLFHDEAFELLLKIEMDDKANKALNMIENRSIDFARKENALEGLSNLQFVWVVEKWIDDSNRDLNRDPKEYVRLRDMFWNDSNGDTPKQ